MEEEKSLPKAEWKLNRAAHVGYFLHHLRMLPQPYESQDMNRIVLAFFCIQGLAILKALDEVNKSQIIEWVYALQIPCDANDPSLNWQEVGFRGGTYHGNKYGTPDSEYTATNFDSSSIAATFSALSILRTCGDDLSRVNKSQLVAALAALQSEEDGGFVAHHLGSEKDLRFVYCATCISTLLSDWSGINTVALEKFIRSCISFEGALGISPGLEAQGGATFCGIASLQLIENNRLDSTEALRSSSSSVLLQRDSAEYQKLLSWILMRQTPAGFQGRCNKRPDSCYSFWNGASLSILLSETQDVIPKSDFDFIASCEFTHGGFSKFPKDYPDLLHSYYSLAFLSTVGSEKFNLASLQVPLQIPYNILF